MIDFFSQLYYVDIFTVSQYNFFNIIGQFVTILSVNKTRETRMGAVRPFFYCGDIYE